MNTAISNVLIKETIEDDHPGNDPLAAFKGILIGFAVGLPLWIGIFLVLIAIF